MIGVRFQRSVPRYVAARVVGRRAPGVATQIAPLRVGHYDDPELPGDGWAHVEPHLAGICGSDLAMIRGEASFYFSPIVSMPFVPGHEVVGSLTDGVEGIAARSRVVLEPVLACAARGLPPCPGCASGQVGLCRRTAHGTVAPGLQTGFCADTGGGWGTMLVAHRSQLHVVPDDLDDRSAVLIEPLACAVHAVLRSGVGAGDTVLVTGAGTMGLLTIAALRALVGPRIVAIAKHPRQRAEAKRLGADEVADPPGVRAVRLATGSMLHRPERGEAWLDGGADVSFECAGNPGALDACLRATRPRGRVVLVGLPGPAQLDLAPVWHRELEVVGAYTYGIEPDGRHTFDIAMELAGRVELAPLVSAVYPLARWAEAIDHASDAGRLDAVKIVFDPRLSSGGPQRRGSNVRGSGAPDTPRAR